MLTKQKVKSQNLEKNKAPQATLTSITKDKDYQTIDDLINIYMTFDSKMLSEPIINPSNFHAALEKELPNSNKEKMTLKLMQYPILKDSLSQCSAFPSKNRKYIYEYLFSLPHNDKIYKNYEDLGPHPFYRFIDEMYPLDDIKQEKNLKIICSALSHYSPEIGNIYFLPELVFPFIKCFPNDNVFVLELLISFFNSIGYFWFQYYPGCPLYHCKLSEKIIQYESIEIYNKIKEIFKDSGFSTLKITEIIWRYMKTLFSEILIKEHWLQTMDFLFCYNHKPEMILYLASSFILKLKNPILKCSNGEELKQILFEVNGNMSLTKIFKQTLELYDKYNRYQLFKYKPQIPIFSTFDKDYPRLNIHKIFPNDYLEHVRAVSEDMDKTDKEYMKKDEVLNKTEKKFHDLLLKEEAAQRHFLSEINKQEEKENLIKHELDIALYHKMKYNDKIIDRKIDKISNLNEVIEKSINIFDNLNNAEVEQARDEMELKKQFENIVLTQRILHEKILAYDKHANKSLQKLARLRQKKEEELLNKYDNDQMIYDANQIKRQMKYINDYDKEFEERDKQNIVENEVFLNKRNLDEFGEEELKKIKFENEEMSNYLNK